MRVLVLLLSLSVSSSAAGPVPVDADAAVRYLLSAQKPNGAFGPHEQEYTDLAWTYPAVHALTILGQKIPRTQDCLRNGRAVGGRTPYRSFTQDVQLRRLLGAPPSLERQTWSLIHRPRRGYGGRVNAAKEELSYYNLTSLHFLVSALEGKISNPKDAARFIAARRAPAGGYADLPEPPGSAVDAEAHLVFTAAAVLTLTELSLPVPDPDRCADWIRSCQIEAGGFRWHPSSKSPSNRPDVWYTRESLRALSALGSRPREPEACARWINSLQNADGGFGDRRGWRSRLYSTFYAVDALRLLTGDVRKAISPKEVQESNLEGIPAGTFKIFHAHHKTPLGGEEMVEAVREMGYHLVACKQKAGKGWDAESAALLEKARAYAARKEYDLELVACPELYNHRLRYLGGRLGDHVANWVFPPGVTLDHPAVASSESAGSKGLSWDEYRVNVIAPVAKLGTLFYPEHDSDMAFGYMIYDDGVYGGNGYNAVHAGHMNGPDRIRLYPWRERYTHLLPFVADGDAHGDIVKWRPKLEQFRTLYIARSHRFADYIDACRNGRTVCVIRDDRVPSGIVTYGSPAAVAYVKARRKNWQWW